MHFVSKMGAVILATGKNVPKRAAVIFTAMLLVSKRVTVILTATQNVSKKTTVKMTAGNFEAKLTAVTRSAELPETIKTDVNPLRRITNLSFPPRDVLRRFGTRTGAGLTSPPAF